MKSCCCVEGRRKLTADDFVGKESEHVGGSEGDKFKRIGSDVVIVSSGEHLSVVNDQDIYVRCASGRFLAGGKERLIPLEKQLDGLVVISWEGQV